MSFSNLVAKLVTNTSAIGPERIALENALTVLKHGGDYASNVVSHSRGGNYEYSSNPVYQASFIISEADPGQVRSIHVSARVPGQRTSEFVAEFDAENIASQQQTPGIYAQSRGAGMQGRLTRDLTQHPDNAP